MTRDEFTQKEEELLASIDLSISWAAQVMDLADIGDDVGEEDTTNEWEARHHCGTCQVRTVMEEVWPAVEKYVDWLRSQIPEAAS